ncbi:unnamed protein product [Parnassius apollo]|uniref:(apollo) hypothetical protein n=1 Tax=Parnassius apollo TaxID=110799 RepID=A0A8S3WJ73_PARAO|nr:unnamed protein product [Parnassius apollo]
MKSHSMVCITKTGNMLDTQVDVVTYNVNKDCEIGQTNNEGIAMLEDTKLINAKSVSKEPIKLNYNDVSCDCLEDLKIDDSLKTKIQGLTNNGSHQLNADRTVSSLKTHVAKETRFDKTNVITETTNKDQHEITTKRQTVFCQCSLHNIETKDARDRHYETEQEISKEVGIMPLYYSHMVFDLLKIITNYFHCYKTAEF